MQPYCQAEDDSRRHEGDQHRWYRHNLICVYIGQLLVVAASNGVAALISWLIYECSDIIEQSVIPGSSNDDRLPT